MTVSQQRNFENPLPSNEEAERIILGGVLLDGRLMSQAAEHLRPDHFYSLLHQRVFAAMLELFESGKAIDQVLIYEVLRREGPIESYGGRSAIKDLSFGVPYFEDLGNYIQIVRVKSQIRELIRTCEQIKGRAQADNQEDSAVLSYAQATINTVCTSDEKKSFVSIGELSAEQVENVRLLRSSGISSVGLQTGIERFDLVTNGLQRSDLIVIGGRPGMGKTMLAGQISTKACEIDNENVVAIFSHEMSRHQLAQRFISGAAQIDQLAMRRGALSKVEMDALLAANDHFKSMKIFVDDTSTLNAMQMKAKLLRLRHEQKRLDLIVIDYLQRMSPSRRSDSRQQEVSTIARELKSLAKDMDVPVIVLSSLSRACEARQDKRPILSDLRESGDIESEADIVAFVYRDNYYDSRALPTGAELIVEKHRNGPTETIRLNFIPQYAKFTNPSEPT